QLGRIHAVQSHVGNPTGVTDRGGFCRLGPRRRSSVRTTCRAEGLIRRRKRNEEQRLAVRTAARAAAMPLLNLHTMPVWAEDQEMIAAGGRQGGTAQPAACAPQFGALFSILFFRQRRIEENVSSRLH